MRRKAAVYNNGILAGYIEKESGNYIFQYVEEYFQDSNQTAISLTLPKSETAYKSNTLFPFFFGLLSEGANKQAQCRLLKIDENDHFSLLLRTAHSDTIGAVTIKAIEQ